jgi:hypothetical protein
VGPRCCGELRDAEHLEQFDAGPEDPFKLGDAGGAPATQGEWP